MRGAATQLLDAGTDVDGKTDPKVQAAARALEEAFHGQLASTKVLDSACGTGNLPYAAVARMKEIES